MLEKWLRLDRTDNTPLSEQLYKSIRLAAQEGHIKAGYRLPSSRALASTLGISRNTVGTAYDLLAAEGLLATKPGACAYLCVPPGFSFHATQDTVTLPTLSITGQKLAQNRHLGVFRGADLSFRPGQPDPTLFPKDEWGRLARRAMRGLKGDALLYGESTGLPELQEALSLHLAATRGVRVAPRDLMILPTVQSALFLLSQCFTEHGDTVWLEDPGYPGARMAFSDAKTDFMPVDENGADTSGLISTPKLIYVTPSHQYPMGSGMSLERRLELLERARITGAIVIEDDYDSEFLWQGRPIPALQALGSSAPVIYLGTAAKSLLPGLRLAWMALPPGLIDTLQHVQRNLGLLANVYAQSAFAHWISAGHHRAHLRRISQIYEKRCQTLTHHIQNECGSRVVLLPSQGGLQIAIKFAPQIDDRMVAAFMAERGYTVTCLSSLYGGNRVEQGLVVGFAQSNDRECQRFSRLLAQALHRQVSDAPSCPPSPAPDDAPPCVQA